MSSEVRVTVDAGVALLTVSDPARRNAINLDIVGKLISALDEVVADEKVGAVVITGEPPAFCAGGDLSELQGAGPAHCGVFVH